MKSASTKVTLKHEKKPHEKVPAKHKASEGKRTETKWVDPKKPALSKGGVLHNTQRKGSSLFKK